MSHTCADVTQRVTSHARVHACDMTRCGFGFAKKVTEYLTNMNGACHTHINGVTRICTRYATHVHAHIAGETRATHT